MKEIKLTQGKIALVDEDDFEYLNSFKWYYNNGYAVRAIYNNNNKKSLERMHRSIMNINSEYLKNQIDHINLNKLDNRKVNLRVVTLQQNSFNRKSHTNSSSKYKGVSWLKRDKKWNSSICKDGKSYYLGRFINEIDAAKKYNDKAIELFGEYAKLNLI